MCVSMLGVSQPYIYGFFKLNNNFINRVSFIIIKLLTNLVLIRDTSKH